MEKMKRVFLTACLLLSAALPAPFAADLPARDPAMVWAARNNLVPLAKTMLESGVSLMERDLMGNTPLHHAVKYPEMLQFLLENGAEVNARNLLGETPLHIAVAYKASVEILLKNGADKNARTLLGRSPADYCMSRGAGRRNVEVLTLLYAK